jgi:hypothetical protein
MRGRLAGLVAVLVVAAVWLSRESGSALAPTPKAPANAAAVVSPGPIARTPLPAPRPTRDPFRFVDVEPPASLGRAHFQTVAPPAPEPVPARVRLVGLVRRAGTLRAALVVDGEVVLASAGETILGFRVLSLDEEGGVRLRDPEGLEATLALPEEP